MCLKKLFIKFQVRHFSGLSSVQEAIIMCIDADEKVAFFKKFSLLNCV